MKKTIRDFNLKNKKVIIRCDFNVPIKDGKIILRLFNAEGDRKQHNITFDMPLSSIEEVDLNGRVIDRKTIKTRTGKSEISISMPRFGLKTFALNLN